MRKSTYLLTLAALSVCTIGYADIHLKIYSPTNEDFCSSLANSTWSGTGSTTGSPKCTYKGSATISGETPNFTLQFDGKRSGPGLCPEKLSEKMSATCNQNQISIQNKEVDLDGSMNGPDKIHLEGSINYQGIKDDLKVDLNRN